MNTTKSQQDVIDRYANQMINIIKCLVIRLNIINHYDGSDKDYIIEQVIQKVDYYVSCVPPFNQG